LDLYLWHHNNDNDSAMIMSSFANDHDLLARVDHIARTRYSDKEFAKENLLNTAVTGAFATTMGDTPEFYSALGIRVAAEGLGIFNSIVKLIKASEKKDLLIGVLTHKFKVIRYPDGHFALLRLENPESKFWTSSNEWKVGFEYKEGKEHHHIEAALKMTLYMKKQHDRAF